MSNDDTSSELFPVLLRHWRNRRGFSQLDLASAADVSSRHISFLETGRSSPSQEMVVQLGRTLDVPLRHVNTMLDAAGHPAWYLESDTTDSLPPQVASALELMKEHHDPFPLLAVDRWYRILDMNSGAIALLSAVMGPAMANESELNLARFTFDPQGGHKVIANFDEVGPELYGRLQRELLSDPDQGERRALLDEIDTMGTVDPAWRVADPTQPSAPSLELRLHVGSEIWSFILMVTTLHAPLDATLEELRIETWFPSDARTADGCRQLGLEV